MLLSVGGGGGAYDTIYVRRPWPAGMSLAICRGKCPSIFRVQRTLKDPFNAFRCLAIDHQGKLLAGDTPRARCNRFDDPISQTTHQRTPSEYRCRCGCQRWNSNAGDMKSSRVVKIPASRRQAGIVVRSRAPRGLTIDDARPTLGRLTQHGPPEIVADGKQSATRFSNGLRTKSLCFEFSTTSFCGKRGGSVRPMATTKRSGR